MYSLIDLSFFIANRPKSVYLSQNDRGARWPTTKTKLYKNKYQKNKQNKSIKIKNTKKKNTIINCRTQEMKFNMCAQQLKSLKRRISAAKHLAQELPCLGPLLRDRQYEISSESLI